MMQLHSKYYVQFWLASLKKDVLELEKEGWVITNIMKSTVEHRWKQEMLRVGLWFELAGRVL